jgi:iron complex outermembrane receptor protein
MRVSFSAEGDSEMVIGGRVPRALAVSSMLVLVLALAAPPVVRAASQAPVGARPDTLDLAALSLDQLMNVEVQAVHGASRYTQRSLDAPTRVTVLTSDDIRDHGYRTLAEALRGVAGLFVSYDHTYDYLGMRGLGHVDDYNARVLVLVDEHRTNDNIFEGALIGEDFPLDLEQVDRIEVIRGPSSALYGSNAVLGVVNVVTRQARQANGLRVSADGGELGSRGGRLSWSRSLAGRGTMQVSASGFATNGVPRLYLPEFDTPETNRGVAVNLDGEDRRRFFTQLTFGDFRFQGVYGRRHKVVPTASFGTVFDAPGFWTTDTREWADLGWRHAFASRLELNVRAYLDDYDYEGSYPSDRSGTGSGPITMNRDLVLGRWAGVEVSAHRTLFGPDDFVAGAEYRNNLNQDQRNWDVSPYQTYYSDRHQSSVWAVYAEDAIEVTNRLRLTAGLRHDDYSSFGGSSHPRVGLIWSLQERTTFKLIYGSAFRVPTSYEVYLWGSGEAANRTVRPETFRTGEAVLESYFGGHYHASASGFVFRGDGFIQDNVVDGVDAFRNSGDVDGTGVEVECSGRWREAELRLGGALETVRFQPGDARLSNSPAAIGQASGKLPLVPGHLFASADVHAIGRRLNPFGVEVPGFTVTDANLIARLPGGAWQVTLGARNVFDVRYGDVAGPEMSLTSVPQTGRTLRARLDARF